MRCAYLDHIFVIVSKYSEYGSVSVGVPQGSVLGPLLYITFANELNNVIS